MERGMCLRRVAGLVVTALALFAASPAPACNPSVSGTHDSDNNSFSFFPIWRSQINGTPGHDDMCGYEGDDLLYGGAGDDDMSGHLGNDTLYGESGNDHLTGGWGDRDILIGGPGNDTYFVYDGADWVREARGAGIDLVASTINYVLPPEVENLHLRPGLSTVVGLSLIEGRPVLFLADCTDDHDYDPCVEYGDFAMGNVLNNEIFGNGLDNELFGLEGHDLLVGGKGDDDLDGGPGNDMLAGFDVDGRWASSEFDVLTGGSGSDVFVIGVSFRSGGLAERAEWSGYLAREQFPEYLGQGMVYIADFDWREGDKIEVWGNISDYTVELGTYFYGPYAAIYWDGSAEGFGSHELVGYALGISSSGDLVPSLDFR